MGAVIFIILAVVGGVLMVQQQQRTAAAAAEQARSAAALANYQRLSAISSRVDFALAQLVRLQEQYDELVGDVAHGSRLDKRLDVEEIHPLSEARANAARAVTAALGDYYGAVTTSALLTDISAASEAENKKRSDSSRWHAVVRRMSDLRDSLASITETAQEQSGIPAATPEPAVESTHE